MALDAAEAMDPGRIDLDAFSRFKHGAVAPAWRFAGEILERLCEVVPETVVAPRLVVTGSCFKYLPLASITLTRSLVHLVNRRRAAALAPPALQTQLYRERLIEGDYSTMPAAQRAAFIAQDVIRVDAELVAGASMLVVDDVRITGFHEGRIAAVLSEAGVVETTFAYWAVIDGRRDATLEKRLNTAAIADLTALRRQIEIGEFVLNSRVCKLILSSPPAQLEPFLRGLSAPLLADLVAGMECNGYAGMATYRPAYDLMMAVLDARAPREVC
jgi:hypothetical protein